LIRQDNCLILTGPAENDLGHDAVAIAFWREPDATTADPHVLGKGSAGARNFRH